jgi:hypothetical protein
LKGIRSPKDQKSLKSIKEDHVEEAFNENSEDQIETKTIGTDQIIVSKKP